MPKQKSVFGPYKNKKTIQTKQKPHPQKALAFLKKNTQHTPFSRQTNTEACIVDGVGTVTSSSFVPSNGGNELFLFTASPTALGWTRQFSKTKEHLLVVCTETENTDKSTEHSFSVYKTDLAHKQNRVTFTHPFGRCTQIYSESADNTLIFYAVFADGCLRVFAVDASLQEAHFLKRAAITIAPSPIVSFSLNEGILLTCHEDGAVRIWAFDWAREKQSPVSCFECEFPPVSSAPCFERAFLISRRNGAVTKCGVSGEETIFKANKNVFYRITQDRMSRSRIVLAEDTSIWLLCLNTGQKRVLYRGSSFATAIGLSEKYALYCYGLSSGEFVIRFSKEFRRTKKQKYFSIKRQGSTFLFSEIRSHRQGSFLDYENAITHVSWDDSPAEKGLVCVGSLSGLIVVCQIN
eukprot:GHVN01042986.1.p1 GENE.GHVN01042986.1~~GHVN01042986.1.p1  ORF type:complete len:407 (-),score=35.63 GHVN01042986.1:18-1238(-)